jgi:hypothetical protein
VIETKSRTFHAPDLAKTRETAAWLCRYRRRWCRAGALAVLCVVGSRRLERVEDDVLIVSLDRLLPALRVGAGTSPRPRFLAARESHRWIATLDSPRVDQSHTREDRSLDDRGRRGPAPGSDEPQRRNIGIGPHLAAVPQHATRRARGGRGSVAGDRSGLAPVLGFV